MSRLHRRIELIANGLVIVAALAFGGVLLQRYFLAAPAPAARVQPTVGATLTAPPGIDWAGQPKTLVLVLQTGCHFCDESAPFYRRLVEAARDKSVRLVAVLPSSVEESRIHLNDLGLAKLAVREATLGSLSVGGTPTLLLVNERGEITDYWVGKLSAAAETEVLSKLNL